MVENSGRRVLPLQTARITGQRGEGSGGGAGSTRMLANQEEILQRMEKMEAGITEILARLWDLEDDE